jgi:malonate transporter
MPPFAETILVVFALIAIGYGAAAFRVLKSETGDGLSDFVFTIAVPLFLFRTIVTATFEHGAPWALWLTYFTAMLRDLEFGASHNPVGFRPRCALGRCRGGNGGLFQSGAARHSVHQSGVYGEAGTR